MPQIIDGKAIAQAIKDEVREATAELKASAGITPGLAFLLVGDNPASHSYVRSKGKACEYCGFHSVTDVLPAESTQDEVMAWVRRMNADPAIHGILVQLPLPSRLDGQAVIEAIDPRKDVDGFHPMTVGKLMIGLDTFVSCTPAGIQELLIRSGIETAGKHAVILGRSNIVGKPLAALLMRKAEGANAIVTVVHTATKDPAQYTRSADILIAAMGKAHYVTADMVKDGAIIIDVGINQVADPSSAKGYKLVGDVDYDAVLPKVSAITPVPGGVGPMTIAMLMKNTLKAAKGAKG